MVVAKNTKKNMDFLGYKNSELSFLWNVVIDAVFFFPDTIKAAQTFDPNFTLLIFFCYFTG